MRSDNLLLIEKTSKHHRNSFNHRTRCRKRKNIDAKLKITEKNQSFFSKPPTTVTAKQQKIIKIPTNRTIWIGKWNWPLLAKKENIVAEDAMGYVLLYG
jgi:2-keto-4-pentenoate hydratase/2-oxohepta-3-ene-1,7-dioic acid hydratase in catechol pathway